MSNNPSIFRGNPDVAQCAFTFDDGPYHLPVELWLDALEQSGAPGTFFFTGEWLDRNPATARKILARGHELAPHSYHHRRMAQIPRDVFFEEMKQTELAYQDATGLPTPTFFRFPYLSHTEDSLDYLAEWNYVDVEGDDSNDWSGIPSEQIIDRVVPFLKNGAILIHHCNDAAVGTPGALRTLVRAALDKGLQPVKVSEILRNLGKTPKHRMWKIVIDVPANDPYPATDYSPISGADDIAQLAANMSEWHVAAQVPIGVGRELTLRNSFTEPLQAHGVTEDSSLFYGRKMAGEFWGYVRAGVSGQDLVLLDYATKEAQADTHAYMLRWAAKLAGERGLTRIVARRDIRRMERICRQMGWNASIILDEN